MAREKGIERYSLINAGDWCRMEAFSDGSYVAFTDHLEALGEAEKLAVTNGEALMRMRSRAEAAEETLAGLLQGVEAEVERLRSEPIIPERWKIAKRLEALQEDSKKPELSAEEGS